MIKITTSNLQALRKLSNHTVRLARCREIWEQADGDMERVRAMINAETGAKTKSADSLPIRPPNAPGKWAYIMAKVDMYLKIGPEKYRKADFFGLPDDDLDPQTLDDITSCFQQFMQGNGFDRDHPIEHIGVSSFYAAMRTLHFTCVRQGALSGADDGVFLDAIVFEHMVDKGRIELFNKVVYNWDFDVDGDEDDDIDEAALD